MIKIFSVFYGHGINFYNVDKKLGTIHAEVNAINKLRFWKKKKKKKVVLFVFRTNKNGNLLTMAKPCSSCMKYIKYKLPHKGYKLYKIYYTDFLGNIQTI